MLSLKGPSVMPGMQSFQDPEPSPRAVAVGSVLTVSLHCRTHLQQSSPAFLLLLLLSTDPFYHRHAQTTKKWAVMDQNFAPPRDSPSPPLHSPRMSSSSSAPKRKSNLSSPSSPSSSPFLAIPHARSPSSSSSSTHTRSTSFTSSSVPAQKVQRPGLQPTKSYDLPMKSHQRVSFDLYPAKVFPQTANSIDDENNNTSINHTPSSPTLSALAHGRSHSNSTSSLLSSQPSMSRTQNSTFDIHPPLPRSNSFISKSSSSRPSSQHSSSSSLANSQGQSGNSSGSNGSSSNNSNTYLNRSRGSKTQLNHMVSSPSSSSSKRRDTASSGGNRYYAQEKGYLQYIQKDSFDSYSLRRIGVPDSDSDSDDDSDLSEVPGFGGTGTSFDDEYAAGNLVSYSFLEAYGDSEGTYDENLHERLEWQAMLAKVLRGDVVASEKDRLRTSGAIIKEDDVWVGIRARMCGRTLEAQKKIIEDARSAVDNTLQEIMQFKASDPTNFDQCRQEVHQVLDRIEQCELLWTSTQAFKANSAIYRDDSFQRMLEALTTWINITERVSEEVNLLRRWANNHELDLRKPPSETKTPGDILETATLADRILKKEDPQEIFRDKLDKNIEPIIIAAREGLAEYGAEMRALGLPIQRAGLEMLISFPLNLIHAIIRSFLAFSKGMANPTMMLIEKNIEDITLYLNIASMIKERTNTYIQPLNEKLNEWVECIPDPEFDNSILECIEYYFELSQNKISDTPIHHYGRGFKDIESLDTQYAFLDRIARRIKDGRIVVAIHSSLLASRMVTNMLRYWERQTTGPVVINTGELQRWQSTTTEQVRKAQRKLFRFYQILSTNYKNATEMAFHNNRFKILLDALRDTGHFLVVPTEFASQDAFIIASPGLIDRPYIIEGLLKGYSYDLEENHDENFKPEYIVIFRLVDPLSWEGPLVEMSFGNPGGINALDMLPGRMRLVCEGGLRELNTVREILASQNVFLDNFEVTADSIAHQSKVNHELNRLRKLLYRTSISVITNTCKFRKKFKGYQEIVHNMFVFAREFGQRGMNIMVPAWRSSIASELVNLCIEWLSFICDDCVPTDLKTYRWTVVAIEFTMVMTRGVNIIALSNDQFTQIRLKVAGCMTLLILHFDIMGARSTAARRQRLTRDTTKLNQDNAVNYDMELIEEFHRDTAKRVEELEESMRSQQNMGKVLDESDSNLELVTYLVSNFSRMSIHWQQGRFIGAGSFGSVYTAVNMDSGSVMAVKEIRMQDPSSMRQALKAIRDEMTVLEMLRHPNIVQYYGVEVHRDRVFLFMEYCQGGSLARLLEYGRIEDETVIQVYTMQMLEGLAYLHQMGIVHRDVKPENVLLDHMGIIKFVDFGAAKVIAKRGQSRQVNIGTSTIDRMPGNVNGSVSSSNTASSTTGSISDNGSINSTSTDSTDPASAAATPTGTSTKLNSMIGTPMYMSPEVITGKCERNLQTAIDIWSLGCCVLEMATGRRPWANLDNEWAIMYHIAAGHLPQLPTAEQLSELGMVFLIRTLEREPRDRPTALMLLQDPWISMIRVSQGIENSTPAE